MLSNTELKKDTLIQLENVPYKVIEYSQKQVGRGGSIVNLKLKSLLDGSIRPKTITGSEKVEPAEINRKKVKFLYSDDKNLHLMDEKTYEQFALNRVVIGESVKFLKEGETVQAQYFMGRIINLELPNKLSLKVVQADPGVRGNSVSAVMKRCLLETGATLQVPLFIKAGDLVTVDTRNGRYVKRSS